MKYNYWLILGAMLTTSLLAQQATNPPPAAPMAAPAPAPAAMVAPATAKTNAPAAKAVKKKSAKKKAEKAPEKKAVAKKKAPLPELKTVPLVAGPASVVASNVNVRGQAKLKSEVVTRITKGQSVTVIEEIVKNNSGPDEPSAWAKIALPPGAHAWINTSFIKAADKTVLPKKLNLRSGPGENYSVIGLLHRGDALKEITTKGEWTEIEPPASAYAFVAAQYLKQEAAAPTPPPAPPEPPPTAATVAMAPPVAPPPTETPALPPAIEPPAVMPAPTPTEPAVQEPPPPRIVDREGIVRGMTSIQAPSKFVLVSPENGRDIDYLFTASKELDLRRYKGLRIIVTGEESLDERWGNTPVITIQRIQVVQ
jgi:SH3-like domain-containing protein